MSENIDTNKEIIVYPNKFYLALWAMMHITWMISYVFIYLTITATKSVSRDLILGLLFFVSFLLLIKILKQFFEKEPLLKIDNEKFFTRKERIVYWRDVASMDLRDIKSGRYTIYFIEINLKNGRNFTINANNIRLPFNKKTFIEPTQELFKAMCVYRSSSNYQGFKNNEY